MKNRLLRWGFLALCLIGAGSASVDIQRLVAAYPEFLVQSGKANTVAWKDGTEMVFDDGVVKATFEDMLDRASLKDQMSMPYPAGWPVNVPDLNEDPGRARYEPFFAKMYGGSKEAVEAQLVDVKWLGGTVRVTQVNGVDKALARVEADVERLPAEVKRYVAEPIGTFNWRSIAGTDRRSLHAYGAAIDFRLPGNAYRYWRWKVNGNSSYPKEILSDDKLGEIVSVFEKHGFIWGGKWYHFDTMHFEYRPELLPPADTESSGS